MKTQPAFVPTPEIIQNGLAGLNIDLPEEPKANQEPTKRLRPIQPNNIIRPTKPVFRKSRFSNSATHSDNLENIPV